MPLLLTESLDSARRELTHQHIESCAECGDEWTSYKETWQLLDTLPEVEPPAHLRAKFLAQVMPQAGVEEKTNVVPFHRRPAAKWLAQAAAVVIIAGGGYFAGHRNVPSSNSTIALQERPAEITSRLPIQNASYEPISLAETRALNASALSPTIEGRPDITNVQFVDSDAADNKIAVQFDITSRWTVSGSPNDKSMVRLLSYVLESEDSINPRSSAIEWVRKTYSNPAYANTEIAGSLAKVLRNDEHQGVRINAVETLSNLPESSPATREALIEALKSDPNPAVRIKAVEALAKLAGSGSLDQSAVDMLRQKAQQDDENLYVRVKAAEALRKIQP
ncbi:MAG TPA: HEAT repeat domain-containing protein [Thermoanaerobaculia bacterium]|nr:HEAT repeat domain-containing protein [Thermoanaerobaculia bacterium]